MANESDENKTRAFQSDLTALLNRYSKDAECDTPDFILAAHLTDCLEIFKSSVRARDHWLKKR